jgi:deazaflavin-dependent oxidoreductase (nitroreductase family)
VAVFAVHREADPRPPDAPGDAVRAAYAALGWVAPRVLAHMPPDEDLYYDQVAQIVVPSWRRGRVVLVGDAAHAVSLLAGQGASLAISGAFVLARCLRETMSVEDALTEYERILRPVAEEKQQVAVKAARWFLPRTRTQLLVRRAALTLARIPVVTRYVTGAVTGKAANLVRPNQRGATSMAITDRKPTGWLRRALRAPIWLYRAHLGWVFGHRLVYVAHRGRRTGALREVVVEAVAHSPAPPSVTVVAAWGKNPDWYRNLLAAPAIEVRVGRHRWHAPDHRHLTSTEIQQTLHTYQRAHPHAWRRLAPLLGFPIDPDDPRWPAVAGSVRAIAFTPHHR